jgi:hypothetical protein
VAGGGVPAIGDAPLFKCGEHIAAGAVGQLRVEHAIDRRVEPQISGGQCGQRQDHQQGKHGAAHRAGVRDQVAQAAQPTRHCMHLAWVAGFNWIASCSIS